MTSSRPTAVEAPIQRYTPTSGPVRTLVRRRWVQVTATVLGVLLLSVGVVGVAVSHHRPVFVLDEWSYTDYLYKIGHGQLWMPPGDIAGQEVIRQVACRGTAPPFYPQAPACGLQHYDPSTFLDNGVNTASIHPPTYFLVTFAGAQAVLATGMTHDLMTAARLVGSLWMAAGLLLLVLLLREVGARPWAIGLVVVQVAFTPRFIEQWQYITPDAANLLVGSTLPLVALRWVRGATPTWFLAVIGSLATAVKAPNLLACCAAALLVLLAPGQARALRSRILAAAAVLGGAAVTSLAALTVRAVLTPADLPPSPLDLAQRAPTFLPRWLLDNLAAFLSPFGRPGTAVYSFSVLLSVLVLGAVFLGALQYSGTPRALACATGALLLAGPPLLVVLTWVTAHQYFPMQERYGFTLLPPAFALAALTWRRTPELLGLSVFTGLYAGAALGGLV